MALKLNVSTLAGHFCTVQADRSWTGKDVKIALQKETDILSVRLRLLVEATVISDDFKLSDLPEGPVADVMLVIFSGDYVEWLEKVAVDGMALAQAPEEIQANREIVLAAVERRGDALRAAAEEFKRDPEVIVTALQHTLDGKTLMKDCVPKDFWESREMAQEVLKRQGRYLHFFAPHFRNDKEIVSVAARSNGYALDYIHEDLLMDKDVILAAVRSTPQSIYVLPLPVMQKFFNDPDIQADLHNQ